MWITTSELTLNQALSPASNNLNQQQQSQPTTTTTSTIMNTNHVERAAAIERSTAIARLADVARQTAIANGEEPREEYWGTNMFIDRTSIPDFRYEINRQNARINCDQELIEAIPNDYPPRNFQYLDGIRHFIIRRREDGYPVAIFDSERVRDHIERDPLGWETEGMEANMAIDEWNACNRNGPRDYWLYYLPFLTGLLWGHKKIVRQHDVRYELRDHENKLVFSCDMDDVLEHWSNVRTSQWSHDAQQNVDEFMDRAHGEGWEDDYFQALRERSRIRTPPPPPEPTPPPYRPPSPTRPGSAMEEVRSSVQPELQPDTSANSGFMPQFEAAEVQHIIYIESDPSEAGSSDDDDDDDNPNDEQSIGYSSDISDILRNPDKYRVTVPGVPRPVERNNEEYEYRDRPFSPVGRGSNEERPGDEGEGIDHYQPWEIDQSEDGITPYIINNNGPNYFGNRHRTIEHDGRSIECVIICEQPMWIGRIDDGQWFDEEWRSGRLVIPGTRIPTYSVYEVDDEEEDRDDGCDTPDIYETYEQDRS